MKFELNKDQIKKFNLWNKKHSKCKNQSGTLGERLLFCFLPTGLGDVVNVTCNVCGKTIDLTESDKW